MKITVKRENKRNLYSVETFRGESARIGTYSNLDAAVMNVGWFTFIISRDELAKQLRMHRKLEQERKAAK